MTETNEAEKARLSALDDLEPIANHVLFEFLDDFFASGTFKKKTDWGFELAGTHEDTTQSPRWGKIIGLGPDVSDEFHIGQEVLIAPLRWTRRVEYKGLTFARTDPDNIIAVAD
jgi:hypothetical protein